MATPSPEQERLQLINMLSEVVRTLKTPGEAGKRSWGKDLNENEFKIFAQLLLQDPAKILAESGINPPKPTSGDFKITNSGLLGVKIEKVNELPQARVTVNGLEVDTKGGHIKFNTLVLPLVNDTKNQGMLTVPEKDIIVDSDPKSLVFGTIPVRGEIGKRYAGNGAWTRMRGKISSLLEANGINLSGFETILNGDFQTVHVALGA